jgi:hypothetical protein
MAATQTCKPFVGVKLVERTLKPTGGDIRERLGDSTVGLVMPKMTHGGQQTCAEAAEAASEWSPAVAFW